MVLLYLLSGITVVKPDEVAVILRWGRLVGATPALQEHGPGLLFSFPRPLDQVVRVPVKHIWEVGIRTLAPAEVNEDEVPAAGDDEESSSPSLNPLTQGYALTGDNNILQVYMTARYRVRDPGEWAFYGPKAEDVLRVEVTSAMVRSLGEVGVDQVLAEGRKNLIATVTRRAQLGLDASRSGLELTSLELALLAPPAAVAAEFDAVQSAFIGAETSKKQAEAYAATAIPNSQAVMDEMLQAARAAAAADLARARGDSQAFLALQHEYRSNPAVVSERLYRDAVEKAVGGAGKVRWVPPPVGGKYNGFRIQVSAGDAGTPASTRDDP